MYDKQNHHDLVVRWSYTEQIDPLVPIHIYQYLRMHPHLVYLYNAVFYKGHQMYTYLFYKKTIYRRVYFDHLIVLYRVRLYMLVTRAHLLLKNLLF